LANKAAHLPFAERVNTLHKFVKRVQYNLKKKMKYNETQNKKSYKFVACNCKMKRNKLEAAVALTDG